MATDVPSQKKPGFPEDLADLPNQAIDLAAQILRASRELETSEDKKNSAKIARMMDDLPGKKFTIAMADQVLRIQRPGQAAERLDHLITEYGIPRYFSSWDRLILWLGNIVAKFAPGFVMPAVKQRVRKDSSHVIISGEKDEFPKYIQQRKRDQFRINFNQLGEAVLGDKEADRRLQIYLDRLGEPDIHYVSVKLSSIVSQISLTGYEQTLDEIKPRLRSIYRAAIEGGGSSGPKFVNLDMEEYRDLHMTVDTFQSILDEPEFENLVAGIVLQAYLPDSFAVLQSLTQWAQERHARTGAGIKVRLVKGANLCMEQVEASLEDWPQAPYTSKVQSDANYKRMLEFACRPENAAAVRVGIASHNLFDIAYAMLLREKRGVTEQTEFEMLEGMANAQALEVRNRSGDMVIYTPVCFDAEFESAVAYLVRRFDENTQPGSLLGALFGLEEGTADWKEQTDAFRAACELAFDPALPSVPNRSQDRTHQQIAPVPSQAPFANVANTDFSLPANRHWIDGVMQQWRERKIDTIPIQVAGEERVTEFLRDGHDPSRSSQTVYQFSRGDKSDLEQALQAAVNAQPGWEARGIAGRAEILRNAAAVMEEQRGESIGTMLVDAGKAIMEADIEVTEAIDFANYYAQSLDDSAWTDGSEMKAAGVVVVTPPWNFPYAIPAGGVLAGLMAGNTVILKPASETVLTSWRLANQLWEAGVPRDVLQFLPLKDGETGKAMISDPRVSIVILTGGYATAQMFQSWRPDLRLYAETSGKNSMIITAAADLDLAVKDLVRGAFGHAGQKCSATSLALVQREVYDNPKFRNQLKDAAKSLKVAGSWDPSAIMTPVIKPPSDELEQGLTTLDDGETWLLEPKIVDDNPALWSPGIKMGVKPGSWYHRTECFGPVLGIIPVADFEEGLKIQNDNEFGLTGGLHSLDPAEIEQWREKVEVGNAYINRTTTGAIVQRQPFGGWKNSCVGTGAKAGGPNYVAAMCDWTETGLPTPGSDTEVSRSLISQVKPLLDSEADVKKVAAACENYLHWWNSYFSQEHDPSNLHGETNHFRYRPRSCHVVRIQSCAQEDRAGLAQAWIACQLADIELIISVEDNLPWVAPFTNLESCTVQQQKDEAFVASVSKRRNVSMRIWGDHDPATYAPSSIGNVAMIRPAVLANGRIELLNYVREQSMTQIVHRYGNII